MGVDEDRVFSAGWFWLACTRRPGRDVAGEGECYVALRSVRGSVLLVLLRHRGDGGCKLGEIAGGANRMSDDKTEGLPALRQGEGVEDRADRGNANRRAAIKESWVYISVCVCGACLCEYMCCCMHLSWSVSCYLYVCACACVYLCSHAKPANSWEFASNDLQTSGDIVRASARCRKLWLVSSRLTAGKGRGRCRVVDN